MTAVSTSKEPAKIAGMFDAIARRYDTLNHLLSAGLDRRWRRRAVRELRLTGRERVLDVCTGTADLAIEAATAERGRAASVVGIDFAGEMLRIGLAKIRAAGLDDRIALARGDAMHMPLAEASVDRAMVAFGIRNVLDPAACLREFARVLTPGGLLAVLEFGTPSLPVLRQLYGWYFRVVLPRVGRAISKHGDAYEYLPASVAEFPQSRRFVEILERSGFSMLERRRLGRSTRAPIRLAFGIVYLYVARRNELRVRRD
jgi:demethylmenaquinone methyltransferase/2-methoxy-6-polyprenyl-1,4-benzoquinol methylase